LAIFAPAAIEAALAGLRASGTATDWLLSFGIGTLIYGKKINTKYIRYGIIVKIKWIQSGAICVTILTGYTLRRSRSIDSHSIAWSDLAPRHAQSCRLAAGGGYWRDGRDWEGFGMRSHHDMGGLPSGPVVPSEHDYALWEKRVDALMKLLSPPSNDLLSTDALRRNIEALGPDAYDAMSYYERWMAGMCNALLQRGVITADELGRKMAEIEARGEDAA
jgi:hypothetical protein